MLRCGGLSGALVSVTGAVPAIFFCFPLLPEYAGWPFVLVFPLCLSLLSRLRAAFFMSGRCLIDILTIWLSI
jgi:hypothetical protein